MSQDKLVYLDYAATTPVDSEVVRVMEPYWQDTFGNAESIHKHGQEAMKAIDDAREIIKNFLGASALREIIFTGSATEANNIAIQGTVSRFAFQNGKKVHIITSAIEHSSVLKPFQYMEAKGLADVSYIQPDSNGVIDPQKIKEALRPNTVLVSIGYANNEIGTIQDIPTIGEIIRDDRESRIKNPAVAPASPRLRRASKALAGKQESENKKSGIHNSKFMIPYFHTDAVQATQFLEMDVNKLNADLVTFSAHKVYGPKGVGVLYIRDGVGIEPLMHGGKQEYGIRPGTLNVSLIVGCARAIELAFEKRQENTKKIFELRNYAIQRIQQVAPYAQINGSLEQRTPNNINVCFRGEDGQSLLIGLSEKGVCVSLGTACAARAGQASHVIQALGKTKEDARASIRISLGKHTEKKDIDFFIDALHPLLHNRK
ncbi:MAG: cysteine desulfurase family protein [bacterium]|nr:cysteine desulfurase family protein [bacterium]